MIFCRLAQVQAIEKCMLISRFYTNLCIAVNEEGGEYATDHHL